MKILLITNEQRKQLVEAIRYVDLVIPEQDRQQKRSDMHEYHMGVQVVYLPRTQESEVTGSRIGCLFITAFK